MVDFDVSAIVEAVKKEETLGKSLMQNVLLDIEKQCGIFGDKEFAERTGYTPEQYRRMKTGLGDRPKLGLLISICLGYNLSYEDSIIFLKRCGIVLNTRECRMHMVYNMLLMHLAKSNNFYDKIYVANKVLIELGYSKLNPRDKDTYAYNK